MNRSWDLQPFIADGNRLMKTFLGGTHNFERNLLRCSWSPDDKYVSGGSSDKGVYIWSHDKSLLCTKFGGHNGSVNETQFNPKHPIIASASSDHTVFIGELPPLP